MTGEGVKREVGVWSWHIGNQRGQVLTLDIKSLDL
jgi:hypothetical protein